MPPYGLKLQLQASYQAPYTSEKQSGLTPRISQVTASPQLGSFLEPQKMAPSLQAGGTSMEKQLSFTACFLQMMGSLTMRAENMLHQLPIKVLFLMFTF